MAISNMDDIQDFVSTPVELPTHTDPVNIFFQTRAIDVPRKLNSLAASFKTYNISIKDTWDTYIGEEGGRIQNYLNNSMTAVTTYINDVVVENQNQFLIDGTQAIADIETEKNNFVTALTTEKNAFKQEVRDEMDGYATTVSYSIADSNSLAFSGETSSDTYDSRGRLTGVTQGHITTSNIVYDSQDRIASYTETVTVAPHAGVSKNYTITYELGKIPKITEV